MVTLSVLFAGSGSGVVDAIDAVFVSVDVWFGAVTTMVNVVDAPLFQFGRSQVTETLPALLHVHPPFDGVTDTNVTSAGRVSVRETLDALDGPLLVASTVYDTLPPATTSPGQPWSRPGRRTR